MPVKIPLTQLPTHVRAVAMHIEGEDVVFADVPTFLLAHLVAVLSAGVVVALSSWSIYVVSRTDDPAPFHFLSIALLPLWAVFLATLAVKWKQTFLVITNRSVLFRTADARVHCVDFRQIRDVTVEPNRCLSLASGSASLSIATHLDESFTVTGMRQASRARDILLSSAIGALNINTPIKAKR
jgi:hypothetical protein